MSIINKMHQELQNHSEDSPILSVMPIKKQKKRVLLFCLISLLLIISIGLSYLIYAKESRLGNTLDNTAPIIAAAPSVTSQAPVVTKAVKQEIVPVIPAVATQAQQVVALPKPTIHAQPAVAAEVKALPQANTAVVVNNTPVVKKQPEVKQAIAAIKAPEPSKIEQPIIPVVPSTANKASVNIAAQKPAAVVAVQARKQPHLEIKKSVLSAAELATIHLNNADKALQKGDTPLAAIEKNKALNLQPQLHSIRQSLALYYYGIGEQQRAKSLLKKGAVQFPEFADFNLMLARIALKNDEPQRAYLYLQQNPPQVQGNIDYHVSYAILAQKLKQYEQAEILYQGLLTQRPNNGRWRMSLAISQDKQGKERLAVASYQKALLQVDLSGNAKKYINQRLTYLANN